MWKIIIGFSQVTVKHEVIEDSSPYYIRFTHPGIKDLLDYCHQHIPDLSDIKVFQHYIFPWEQSQKILSLVPAAKVIPFQQDRVSLFITAPGYAYTAHKDGANHRFSLNYTIRVLDNKCKTSWYSDDDLKEYKIDDVYNSWSREIEGFDNSKHTPIKTMIAKPYEGVLVNTDMWHDWDNSNSNNYRIVLTLRHKYPADNYFNDVRRTLFGY